MVRQTWQRRANEAALESSAVPVAEQRHHRVGDRRGEECCCFVLVYLRSLVLSMGLSQRHAMYVLLVHTSYIHAHYCDYTTPPYDTIPATPLPVHHRGRTPCRSVGGSVGPLNSAATANSGRTALVTPIPFLLASLTGTRPVLSARCDVTGRSTSGHCDPQQSAPSYRFRLRRCRSQRHPYLPHPHSPHRQAAAALHCDGEGGDQVRANLLPVPACAPAAAAAAAGRVK